MKSFTVAIVCTLFALASSRPPNFVVFLADDLGYGDIGCYGHPPRVSAICALFALMDIDLLAQGGMKFTQFYSACPICTPSRGGLMTGRLPIRNGIFSSAGYPLDMVFRVFMPSSTGGLQSDEVTVADLLKPLNYTSLLVGKWHLGHLNTMPTQRGFDEFYGLPYAQDEGCQPANPCLTKWPGVPLYHNETIIEQPVDLSTLTPRYNEKALEFISSNKDNPFLLIMAYDEVHVPLFASNSFVNTSARGLYGDAVQEMDDSIGQIVGKLRDMGLLEDTLIVFSSDNGAWTEEGLNGGTNGLLRGQKGETWEGGMRIPAIFYWTGHIAAGKVSLALGSQLDFLATFAELAGTPLPNRTLDSYSLVPVLLGQAGASNRDSVFYYRDITLMAVRYGDFKAHYFTRSGWGLDKPEKHDPPLLYHLGHDPSEQYQLNATEYSSILEEINSVVEAHNKTIGSLPPSQLDPYDFDCKVCPCCNQATHCVCTAANGPVSDERSVYLFPRETDI